MAPEKDTAKAYLEKKYRYLQECLEYRLHFTPLVFSSNGIPGKEARDAIQKMA